jgi:7,8-dihydropterin-6-yl-methyl-4-(beta-D-ribofuranosyl)aminobenzene 5'-phosphate synthase
MQISLRRRQLMLGSAALLAQAGFTARAIGQALKPDSVPTVDSLTIRVLTDSNYDTPRATPSKAVRVSRVPFASQTDYRKTLHNEWGLALALESRIGSETRHIQLDFGYTANALLNNMEIMGVDGAKTQAMIISHGHFDHYGGLNGFLKKYRAALPADLTLYVGGEDNFCERKSPRGAGQFAEAGVLDRRELEAMKVKIVLCEKPTAVLGHAFTTGNITRRSFERVLPTSMVEYVFRNGAGCKMPELEAKAGGKPVSDQHYNEHATCFNVRDRGLVVITSCGHAGIINSTRQAMEVSGVNKIYAVLGGMHLFSADEEYLRRSVAELKALDPEAVIPMHCSGPNFIAAVREQMPDRLITSTTGTILGFGA